MTKNPEVLEVLDNWTGAEIAERIAELREAQGLREEWASMTRDEKDAAWDATE